MYNRTAAYDSIVSQLGVNNPATPAATPVPEGAGSVRKIFSRTSVLQDGMRTFRSDVYKRRSQHL